MTLSYKKKWVTTTNTFSQCTHGWFYLFLFWVLDSYFWRESYTKIHNISDGVFWTPFFSWLIFTYFRVYYLSSKLLVAADFILFFFLSNWRRTNRLLMNSIRMSWSSWSILSQLFKMWDETDHPKINLNRNLSIQISGVLLASIFKNVLIKKMQIGIFSVLPH